MKDLIKDSYEKPQVIELDLSEDFSIFIGCRDHASDADSCYG